jgi:hypothetical protein
MDYPNGYGTARVSLDEMRRIHGPHMHPEFARRFFKYMEAKNGLLGVGGGFRTTQPTKPGFAPDGKSFHQAQTFASGIVGYCAVDLVVGTGGVHRAPTWSECADAPGFMLHTFVSGEPWHIQPLEIRGHATWVSDGRKDPVAPYVPPVVQDPTPLPSQKEVEMIALDYKPGTPEWTAYSWTGVELAHVFNGYADQVLRQAGVPRQTVTLNQMDAIVQSSQTKTAAPSTLDAGRKAAWAAQRG